MPLIEELGIDLNFRPIPILMWRQRSWSKKSPAPRMEEGELPDLRKLPRQAATFVLSNGGKAAIEVGAALEGAHFP